MSDFAGPILGTIGAVVGFTVGGPAGASAGWTIGSTIGGAYSASQKVIPGPKIGEVQQQTSQEGGPIPIVFGRSHPIAGNVIADGGPVIVKKRKRQGKGGPKVETESAFRTYAVGFCEGDVTFVKVWKNNTLVYDITDSEMAAENEAFLEYARFYGGSHGQMPDPDLEAIYGVGDTPAFRGRAYMVLSREDVTDQRGAWSQWKVVVFRSAVGSYTTPPYPMFWLDTLRFDGQSIDGYLRSTIVRHEYGDAVDFGSYAVDGVLAPTAIDLVDLIEFSLFAIDGQLGPIVIPMVDPIDLSHEAMDSALFRERLRYENYAPEQVDLSAGALDGELE